VLGVVLSLIFAISARGQTEQDTGNVNELTHYLNVLDAFDNACTNAIKSKSTILFSKCNPRIISSNSSNVSSGR
jgi:hypothetical protein